MKTDKLFLLLVVFTCSIGISYASGIRRNGQTGQSLEGKSFANQNQPTTKVIAKGKVVDSNGEPVIGASVKEMGTNNGTITDINGDFHLQVNNGSKLHFSYIGFIDVELNAGTHMNVIMKEKSDELNEVVVVGYGVQKRASITGSVASIQSKDLVTVKSANLTNSIVGKLPGLRAVQRSGAPGDDQSNIDIRGFGNALIIVDGVERDFSQIDPNDVESISILKDASAAVYGFKGANGVILVKTKNGDKGKAHINYNGYLGFQKITRYPKLYSGYEYAMLYNEAQENIGVKAPFSTDELNRFKDGIGVTDWFNSTVRKSSPIA